MGRPDETPPDYMGQPMTYLPPDASASGSAPFYPSPVPQQGYPPQQQMAYAPQQQPMMGYAPQMQQPQQQYMAGPPAGYAPQMGYPQQQQPMQMMQMQPMQPMMQPATQPQYVMVVGPNGQPVAMPVYNGGAPMVSPQPQPSTSKAFDPRYLAEIEKELSLRQMQMMVLGIFQIIYFFPMGLIWLIGLVPYRDGRRFRNVALAFAIMSFIGFTGLLGAEYVYRYGNSWFIYTPLKAICAVFALPLALSLASIGVGNRHYQLAARWNIIQAVRQGR